MTADTTATRWLDEHGVQYELVETQPASSAEESAAFQGIGLNQMLRTIVVRRGDNDFVFVLVPGGRRFDWPKLRAHLGVHRLSLPDAGEAKHVTGFERGTITPFGSTNSWPVIADSSIEALAKVAIGGGQRGVNVHISPRELVRATNADVVDVTVEDTPSS